MSFADQLVTTSDSTHQPTQMMVSFEDLVQCAAPVLEREVLPHLDILDLSRLVCCSSSTRTWLLSIDPSLWRVKAAKRILPPGVCGSLSLPSLFQAMDLRGEARHGILHGSPVPTQGVTLQVHQRRVDRDFHDLSLSPDGQMFLYQECPEDEWGYESEYYRRVCNVFDTATGVLRGRGLANVPCHALLHACSSPHCAGSPSKPALRSIDRAGCTLPSADVPPQTHRPPLCVVVAHACRVAKNYHRAKVGHSPR